MEAARKGGSAEGHDGTLTAAERELLGAYRDLPPKYQRRLRERAGEYGTLVRASRKR